MCNGELYLLNSGNTALIRVTRVPGAHVRKFIDGVKLRSVERQRGRILNQQQLSVLLQQPFAAHRVLLILLLAAGDRVFAL